MEMTGTNGACLMGCLSELNDPHQPSNGTFHDFRGILVIAVAAMLSDSDTVEDIADWAHKKAAWLHRFLPRLPRDSSNLMRQGSGNCGF
jgi:DDE_Tnp_1-associated